MSEFILLKKDLISFLNKYAAGGKPASKGIIMERRESTDRDYLDIAKYRAKKAKGLYPKYDPRNERQTQILHYHIFESVIHILLFHTYDIKYLSIDDIDSLKDYVELAKENNRDLHFTEYMNEYVNESEKWLVSVLKTRNYEQRYTKIGKIIEELNEYLNVIESQK